MLAVEQPDHITSVISPGGSRGGNSARHDSRREYQVPGASCIKSYWQVAATILTDSIFSLGAFAAEEAPAPSAGAPAAAAELG